MNTRPRRWLGNLLALALEYTRSADGSLNLDGAAEVIAHAVMLDRFPVGTGHNDGERIAQAIDRVAARHSTDRATVMSLDRRRGPASVRFEAWWECRQLDPPPSYQAIADYFCLRSHQPVIVGVRKHAGRIRRAALAASRDGLP